MGFTYLQGKRWAEVTRDERFFCQRLYQLVNADSVEAFAVYVSRQLQLDLPLDGEWEIGFEVCFYRDLWQLRGKNDVLYSPKRTFDLCLFGESVIVIIEAKAAGAFDENQNETFKRDIDEVRRLTGLERVELVGLCSSQYILDPSAEETFGTSVVTWKQLARRYADDEILHRADTVFEHREAFSSYSRNADTTIIGKDLVEAHQNGTRLWVGRGGGVDGSRFRDDVRTGRWRTFAYSVNITASSPPSRNYFSLEEFVRAVGG